MALVLVLNGTTGLTDGDEVSEDGANTEPVVFASLDVAVDAHIRCDSGYWSDDQDFDVPAEVEVSFDGGSTWYGNADEPITAPEIEDINFPIKLKQVSAAAGSAGSFVTDGTYTAITALATVGTLTATPGDTIVDLSWADIANESSYLIERQVDGGGYSTLTTKAAGSTSHSDTGLTNGSTYQYRIKGVGTGRYSDSAAWSTSSAVVPAAVIDDEFTSLDTTTKWLTVTSSSGSVSILAGRAVVNKPATSDRAVLVAKANSYAHGSANKVLTALLNISVLPTVSTYQVGRLSLFRKTAAPVSGDIGTPLAGTSNPVRIEHQNYSGTHYYRFSYTDTGGTFTIWKEGTGWTTDLTGYPTNEAFTYPSGDTAQYRGEIELSSSSGVRLALRSADGVTLHKQTAWIPWSSIGGSGDNYWPMFGGYQFTYDTAFTGAVEVDWIHET